MLHLKLLVFFIILTTFTDYSSVFTISQMFFGVPMQIKENRTGQTTVRPSKTGNKLTTPHPTRSKVKVSIGPPSHVLGTEKAPNFYYCAMYCDCPPTNNITIEKCIQECGDCPNITDDVDISIDKTVDKNINRAPVVNVEKKEIEDTCVNCTCLQAKDVESCKSCSMCVLVDSQMENVKIESFHNGSQGEPATTAQNVSNNSTDSIEVTTLVGRNNDKMKSILGDTILMLSVPVLLVLSFIIYRKAKHLWQRRHYIRNNYLIDGFKQL